VWADAGWTSSGEFLGTGFVALSKREFRPFEEARALLKRFGGKDPAKGHVLFETGYGPSGLPHIGTFGEVSRNRGRQAGLHRHGVMRVPFILAGPNPRRDQNGEFIQICGDGAIEAQIFADLLHSIGKNRAAEPGIEGAAQATARAFDDALGRGALLRAHAILRQFGEARFLGRAHAGFLIFIAAESGAPRRMGQARQRQWGGQASACLPGRGALVSLSF
jgi:hypothetical protein